MSGAICGGVISETQYKKYVKKNGDPLGIMGAVVLPNEKYKLWKKGKKVNLEKYGRIVGE